MRPLRKLLSKFIGPFEILSRKGKVAYTLALLESMARTYLTFYVSLLEPYFLRPRAQLEVVLEIDEEGEDTYYEVEEVVDHKI